MINNYLFDLKQISGNIDKIIFTSIASIKKGDSEEKIAAIKLSSKLMMGNYVEIEEERIEELKKALNHSLLEGDGILKSISSSALCISNFIKNSDLYTEETLELQKLIFEDMKKEYEENKKKKEKKEKKRIEMQKKKLPQKNFIILMMKSWQFISSSFPLQMIEEEIIQQ